MIIRIQTYSIPKEVKFTMSDIRLQLDMQNMTQIVVITHTIESSPGLTHDTILIYMSDNTNITILHMFKS